VLEQAGAGELAVLGDVADDDDGDAVVLGEGDELAGDRADLGEVAGEAVLPAGVDGLDRVDDQRAELLDALGGLAEHLLDALLGHQQQVLVAGREPGAARADLGDRLLAAGVEHEAGAAGEADAGLQQERRLADARGAAEQDDAAGDEAAAEDAVDLVHAAGAARLAVDLGLGVGGGDHARGADGALAGAGRGELGLDGVPGVAARALAEPAGGDGIPQAWQTQRGAAFLALLIGSEGDPSPGAVQVGESGDQNLMPIWAWTVWAALASPLFSTGRPA
jgi:hypothetical protein